MVGERVSDGLEQRENLEVEQMHLKIFSVVISANLVLLSENNLLQSFRCLVQNASLRVKFSGKGGGVLFNIIDCNKH